MTICPECGKKLNYLIVQQEYLVHQKVKASKTEPNTLNYSKVKDLIVSNSKKSYMCPYCEQLISKIKNDEDAYRFLKELPERTRRSIFRWLGTLKRKG